MATVQQMWEASDFEYNISDVSGSSATVYYIVYGVDSEADAIAEVMENTMEDYEGLPRQTVSIQERLTETEWKVRVNYGISSSGNVSNGEIQEPQFNFEISTETKRIVRSIQQIAKYPSRAPDSMGINDGDGVDVVCPVAQFSETVWLRPSQVTTAWKKKVMQMVGTMNSNQFRGYNSGELLFLGCNGSRNGDTSKDLWQVSFRFAFRANEENIKIGDWEFPLKLGWDIIWVRYQEKTFVGYDDYRKIIRAPEAGYIERVYHMSNFNELGI